jgi:hypothetical protein
MVDLCTHTHTPTPTQDETLTNCGRNSLSDSLALSSPRGRERLDSFEQGRILFWDEETCIRQCQTLILNTNPLCLAARGTLLCIAIAT